MLLQSHIYLGNQLSKLIDQNYKRYFILGNVTPDMSPEHKVKKHEYEYLKEWFINYVDRTMQMELGDRRLAYYRLGVINHYLADFFCRAHNDDSIKKRYVKHFSYEKSLHEELKQSNPVEQFSRNISLMDMDKMLKLNHSRYLQADFQTANDLRFINNITAGVVNSASDYIWGNSTRQILLNSHPFGK